MDIRIGRSSLTMYGILNHTATEDAVKFLGTWNCQRQSRLTWIKLQLLSVPDEQYVGFQLKILARLGGRSPGKVYRIHLSPKKKACCYRNNAAKTFI